MTRPKAERMMVRALEDFVGVVRPKAEEYPVHNERCHARWGNERCRIYKGHDEIASLHRSTRYLWRDGELVHEFKRR